MRTHANDNELYETLNQICGMLLYSDSEVAASWYLVAGDKNKSFESVIEYLGDLFSDLQKANKFINKNKFTEAELITKSQAFALYQDKCLQMTNERFLTQFIADLTDERNVNAKKNLCAFAGWLALTLLGVDILYVGIRMRWSIAIVLGILQICAYAGLVCSLIFNLSLGLLIPSSIILGLMTIASIVILSLMYKQNNQKVEKLSTAINLMNNKLTKAKNEQTRKSLLNPGKKIDKVDKGSKPGSKENDNSLDDEKNNDDI